MAVVGALSDRKGSECTFNGLLSTYVESETEQDEVLKEAFGKIVQADHDARLCKDLQTAVSMQAVSNQIIRYKDVRKLKGKPLILPYILYETRNDDDRAMLIVPAGQASSIYAKGMYYCMTEPGSEFIDMRDEIIAVSCESADEYVSLWNSIFREHAGALQRRADKRHYKNYDQLKAEALQAAEDQKNNAQAEIASSSRCRELIRQYVINWFLLKKVLYVQYMQNKEILKRVHGGNVKKQRTQAKANADQIIFLSLSQMWHLRSESQQ